MIIIIVSIVISVVIVIISFIIKYIMDISKKYEKVNLKDICSTSKNGVCKPLFDNIKKNVRIKNLTSKHVH